MNDETMRKITVHTIFNILLTVLICTIIYTKRDITWVICFSIMYVTFILYYAIFVYDEYGYNLDGYNHFGIDKYGRNLSKYNEDDYMDSDVTFDENGKEIITEIKEVDFNYHPIYDNHPSFMNLVLMVIICDFLTFNFSI